MDQMVDKISCFFKISFRTKREKSLCASDWPEGLPFVLTLGAKWVCPCFDFWWISAFLFESFNIIKDTTLSVDRNLLTWWTHIYSYRWSILICNGTGNHFAAGANKNQLVLTFHDAPCPSISFVVHKERWNTIKRGRKERKHQLKHK